MSRLTTSLLALTTTVLTGACATARSAASATTLSIPAMNEAGSRNGSGSPAAELICAECTAIPMSSDVTNAIETRLEALKARGGDCSRYGSVLESSYRSGRITLRPYMWRVGRHLASGEAKPNGDMTLAREIDALNVGVRTVDDVVFSMEHEAVHITFALASGVEATEDKANQIVRSCQA